MYTCRDCFVYLRRYVQIKRQDHAGSELPFMSSFFYTARLKVNLVAVPRSDRDIY